MQLAVVAAGFTPGESDKLRRSMAAWKRKGGLEHFEKRLVDGMRERGYAEQFARQIYKQILGFGEYGFPESHSASFALLVYVSCWLKCYEPAAFTCALLNSQPMGFYSPSQLTQDLRRHNGKILPADVCVSEWECTLEYAESEPDKYVIPAKESSSSFPRAYRHSRDISSFPRKRESSVVGTNAMDPRFVGIPHTSRAQSSARTDAQDPSHNAVPALRLGLCMVKGLPEVSAQKHRRRALDTRLHRRRRSRAPRRAQPPRHGSAGRGRSARAT